MCTKYIFSIIFFFIFNYSSICQWSKIEKKFKSFNIETDTTEYGFLTPIYGDTLEYFIDTTAYLPIIKRLYLTKNHKSLDSISYKIFLNNGFTDRNIYPDNNILSYLKKFFATEIDFPISENNLTNENSSFKIHIQRNGLEIQISKRIDNNIMFSMFVIPSIDLNILVKKKYYNIDND